MLKRISPIMLLTVALTVSQLFLSTPANARPRHHHRYYRGQGRSRVVTPRRSRIASPSKKGGGGRIVRLSNGDVRLPNGQVVSSNRLIRLRNQGYWRLPNGDFILPNQQIVPVRNTVRLQNGHFRLPNGIIVII
ncbi:MAG: hypothetical protein EA343_13800 [Nodularia sp. (in: Bacteria)]|nr:MAG: hypothetical protein EA343_13800 [Nodularia sp. (in: cyanobacteria)]